MTDKEFEKEKEQIEVDYKNKKQELYEKYALSNNPYKIGDIIKDHYHIIKIKKIMYTIIHNKPSCVYFGTPLKSLKSRWKNTVLLTPKKFGKFVKDDEIVYQINVKEKLKS